MLSKITVNTTAALHGKSGERLRRSIMTMPGVQQVTITYPKQVEVHFDGSETGAGHLITAIRALSMRTV
ncbi:MAG TPA: hypothetical protein VMW83_06145 [Spirochaetia bacterium]|nr:hypothetical protein [Spirochaetia bacterium]